MRPRKPQRRAQNLFDWLDLVETDGPFLSRPALKAQFATGLPRPDEAVDGVRATFRTGFTDWERAWSTWMGTENRAEGSSFSRYLDARDAWVRTMIDGVLEWGGYNRTDDGAVLTASNLDRSVTASSSAVLDVGGTRAALLLVVDPAEDLTAPGADGWTASAIDRAAALLRASADGGGARVPVGLVTDGRWWALVWQSGQGSVGSGVFDGALFREEPDLRDAFWALARLTSLAGGATDRRLPALLEASVASAEQITDALGSQVRASVELLVQAFSASHLRAVASGTPSPLPADGHEIYDAAVTTMMRIVFLLFAEANELLPTEQLYREAYAISDVLERLDERRRYAVTLEGDEALAADHDTWHRLLATSRALYEGATFEDLRMPAYGGSLFDPARFPWLTATNPDTGGLRVLVDDRVMFYVLRSVQHAQVGGEDRQVSFRELDVEQIGYAYEGLLGYSARYTDEVVVGLVGPRGSEPEVLLEVLHELNDDADEDADDFAKRLIAWVKEEQPGARTSTLKQLAKAYTESGRSPVQDEARRRLRPVIGDDRLVEELAGYYKLMRLDPRGLPYVVPAGGLVVVETQSRATSGTHYTPRSLAEEVVHHALEPLVYSPGPLETADTSQWHPISSSEILDLKVADIAVGSGAFLVAAARYLAARLLEAWDREGITRGDATAEQRQRRRVGAVREVIAHCLYGADINPMAVEMCKLSLWLVSLDPARPFSFVDDKIRCGNSLLGLTDIRQLRGLHIDPTPARLQDPGFTVDVDDAIQRASEIRRQLATPVSDSDIMRSTRAKRALLAQLDHNNGVLRLIADGIVAAGLSIGGKPGRHLDAEYEALALALAEALPDQGLGDFRSLDNIVRRGLTPSVGSTDARWQPLHWVVEFVDVMVEHGGFDAVIGNPPFYGSRFLSGAWGSAYREWLVHHVAGGSVGLADLMSYFVRRAQELQRETSTLGMVVKDSITSGENRKVAFQPLDQGGGVPYRAQGPAEWPTASAHLRYMMVWLSRGYDHPISVLNGQVVPFLGNDLKVSRAVDTSRHVLQSDGAFVGSYPNGVGFRLTCREAQEMLVDDPRNRDVLCHFLTANDLQTQIPPRPTGWVINFRDMSEETAKQYAAPYSHIEINVLPERQRRASKTLQEYWWRFKAQAKPLYAALAATERFICFSQDGKNLQPALVDKVPDMVIDTKVTVVAKSSYATFAALSSSIHKVWVLGDGHGLIGAFKYLPAHYATFPLPKESERLAELGSSLHDLQGRLMQEREVGLRALYDYVTSAAVEATDIVALRSIHERIDIEVGREMGWRDLDTRLQFTEIGGVAQYLPDEVWRLEVRRRLQLENLRRANRGSSASEPAGQSFLSEREL